MEKFIIIASLISSTAFADAYKCTAPGGRITYQQGPCAGNIDAPPLDIRKPSPEVIQKMQVESMQRDIEASRRELERQRAEAIARRNESNLRTQQMLDEARAIRHEYYRERQAIYDQQLEQLRHDRYCRESLHISPHDGCY